MSRLNVGFYSIILRTLPTATVLPSSLKVNRPSWGNRLNGSMQITCADWDHSNRAMFLGSFTWLSVDQRDSFLQLNFDSWGVNVKNSGITWTNDRFVFNDRNLERRIRANRFILFSFVRSRRCYLSIEDFPHPARFTLRITKNETSGDLLRNEDDRSDLEGQSRGRQTSSSTFFSFNRTFSPQTHESVSISS